MYSKWVIFCFCILFYKAAFAQRTVSVRDSAVSAYILGIKFGGSLPGGDLADRFGANLSLGAGIQYKTKKGFLFGIQADYMFSNNVLEDTILDRLANNTGAISGISGLPAIILFSERGILVQAQFGYRIPVLDHNPNSGLTIYTGLGFLQHKIHINIEEEEVPQLAGEYIKGYDRLSSGIATSFTISYIHLSNNKRQNFNVGIEIVKGWTSPRRSYQFDSMSVPTGIRNDLLYSFKITWMLPLYPSPSNEISY